MRRQSSWLFSSLLAGSLGVLAVACTPEAIAPGNPSTGGNPSTNKSRELPCEIAEIVDVITFARVLPGDFRAGE